MSISIGESAAANCMGVAWSVLKGGPRPLCFVALSFLALAILLSISAGLGWVTAHRMDLLWYAHEAIFGVMTAAFVGFLYSPAGQCTKRDRLPGVWLALFAGIWLAGRVAMLMQPSPVAAALEGAFLFLAPLPLYRDLKQSRVRTQMVLVELLFVLAVLNFLYHAATLGMSPVSPGTFVGAATIVGAILARTCVRRCGASRMQQGLS